MNRRYRIGVFDSGVGGLELLGCLKSLMPGEDFYYFADTVNCPYGERSAKEVERFLEEIVDGMLLRRVKLLVIACNTASTVFHSLSYEHPIKRRLRDAGVDAIPITTTEAVAGLSLLKPTRILVAGTRLTVESGVYQDMLGVLLPEAEIRMLAAPKWVEVIEDPLSDREADIERRRESVREVLQSELDAPPDAIVLGCTHFPRLSTQIREVLQDNTAIVNPAEALAHFVKNFLDVRGLDAPADDFRNREPAVLFTNGPSPIIEGHLKLLGLGGRYEVRRVDIRSDLSGKSAFVIGFGVTGQSVVRYLLDKGPSAISVRDSDGTAKDKVAELFPGVDIDVETGERYLDGLGKADVIFRSPGVPAQLNELKEAERAGIPVMSDIDLFLRRAPGRKVAISGTNGKTTTTILTHRLFQAEIGEDAHLVGNIGRPVLDLLPRLNKRSVSAAELSSFQLEKLTALPVEAAILLNLSPDHLDRHGDMRGYIEAKGRIFTLLDYSSTAIYNIDCEPIVNVILPRGCRALMLPFSSTRRLVEGAFIDGADLVLRHPARGEWRMKDYLETSRFLGTHNLENILSSTLAAFSLGVSGESIAGVLRSFRGVRYRIEHFFSYKGVDVYDDSKGTNTDSTMKAVASLARPIRLVAGGINKGMTFDGLAAACAGRVEKAYLFGEIAGSFGEALSALQKPIGSGIFDDLEAASVAAMNEANPGEAVLFSPASASPPGQKYYQRGNAFKRLVAGLCENELEESGDYLPDPLAE